MHCQCPRLPKLTQLQSRFAACLGASLTLLVIYLILTSPRLAYAHELNFAPSRPSLLKESTVLEHDRYQPPEEGESAPWPNESNPGVIQRLRARQLDAGTKQLPGNNNPGTSTIEGGQVQQWLFPKQVVQGTKGIQGSGLPGGFLDFTDTYGDNEDMKKPTHNGDQKQNAGTTVFVSINTCAQPSGATAADGTPLQLVLYASTSSQAGPSVSDPGQQRVPLVEGYASARLTSSGDVHIAVEAPTLPGGALGQWRYSVAASIDNYYHQANLGLPPLYVVDTDTSSALLITDNLTQADSQSEEYKEWMALTPPFTLFSTVNTTTSIDGMRSSFCGLSSTNNITQADPRTAKNSNAAVQMSMISRGLGKKPKQQFYLRGLQGGKAFQAILAMDGNSTKSGGGVIGGGGRVYTATNLTTKSDGNCALVYSLPFCSDVAYSVPSNPFRFPNTSGLVSFYDDYASQLYTNFSLSLQIIPCNTTPAAQYSLTKNCDDCAAAYKAWVCSVTIPRCEDFSKPASGTLQLYPRNVAQAFPSNGSMLSSDELHLPFNPMSGAPSRSNAKQQVLGGTFASNQSRVSRIDSTIKPGPYKELLPCEDLCYDLMRNCPASLGFKCPYPGRGLEAGYGKRDTSGRLSCNYAGAVDYHSGAMTRSVSLPLNGMLLLVTTFWVAFAIL